MELEFELMYGNRERKVVVFEKKPICITSSALIGDAITVIDNDYLYDPKLDLSSMTTTSHKFAKWQDRNQQKEYFETHYYFVFVEYDKETRKTTKIGFLNYKNVMDYIEGEMKRQKHNVVDLLRLNLKAYYYYYFAFDFKALRDGNSELKERFNSLFTRVLPMNNKSGIFSIINQPNIYLNDACSQFNNKEKWEITKESIIRKDGLYNLYNIVEKDYLHISCFKERIYLYSELNFKDKILVCLE